MLSILVTGTLACATFNSPF